MLTCLRGCKAVLCEKPFTLNAVEAERVTTEAGSCGVFAMEAMWTRFLPSMVTLREWLAAGSIGNIHIGIGSTSRRQPVLHIRG